MTHIITLILLALNLATFIAFGLDKWKAKRARWRTPESTLLLLAAVGGSLGAWLGMKVWRHKTLHRKFRYGVPTLLFLHLALALWVLWRWC